MSVRGGDITLLLNKGLGLSPTSLVLLHLLPKMTRGKYISTHSKTKTLMQGQVILNRGSDWTCRWSGSSRKAIDFTRSAWMTQGGQSSILCLFSWIFSEFTTRVTQKPYYARGNEVTRWGGKSKCFFLNYCLWDWPGWGYLPQILEACVTFPGVGSTWEKQT